MTEMLEIYKCDVCGNIVEVLHQGIGKLVCCGKEMKLLEEKREGEGKEKHLPVIEKSETGIKVKVGSVEHPMDENHYIEWIEIIANEKICRKFLKPGEKPEAKFEISADNIEARVYCNLHGLWKKV